MAEMQDPQRPPIQELLEHREWLRRLARRLVADENAADEIVQQVWLDAVARPPATLSSPRGWLTVAVRNAARKFGRAASRRRHHEAAMSRPEVSASQPDVVAQVELQQLVGRAVLDLDEPYRTVVLLRYFDELSAAEIAERQGIPLETVRTRLKRGLSRLKDRLDKEHGGSRAAWIAALSEWEGRWGEGAAGRADGEGGAAGKGGRGGGRVRRSARPARWGAAVAALIVPIVLGAAIWVALRSPDDGSSGGARSQGEVAEPSPGPSFRSRAALERDSGGAAPPPAATDPGADDSLPPPVDAARLDPARHAAGHVVDRNGAPVAGAELRVVRGAEREARSLLLADPASVIAALRSASDGSFAAVLPSDADYDIAASAEGFAPAAVAGARPGQAIRIVMRPAVTLSVLVLDADGLPLEGVALTAHEGAGTRRDRYIGVAPASDARGMVWFRDVPARMRVLISTKPEDPYRGWADCLAPAYGTDKKTMVCVPKARVRGAVADAITGAPVPGAVVVGAGGRAVSDATGRFELFVPSLAAEGPFHVSADGYATTQVSRTADGEIRAGLGRGAAVAGRVVRIDGGLPVAGARVSVISSPTGDDPRAGVTNAAGEYRVECVPQSLPFSVVIEAAGMGRAIAAAEAPGGRDLVEIEDVRLGAASVIEGCLVDDLGDPVADATVRCTVEPAADGTSAPSLLRDALVRTTDVRGWFRIDGVAGGRYVVTAYQPGMTTTRANCATLPGQTTVLRLQQPPMKRVPVRVVDRSGEGLEGISVLGSGAQSAWAETDSDGRAVVRVSPETEHVSVAFEPGYDHHVAYGEPIAETGETTIPMHPAVRLVGITEDSAGRRLPGISVFAVRGSECVAAAKSDPEGVFSLRLDARWSVALWGIRLPPRDATVLLGCWSQSEESRVLRIKVEPVPVDRRLRVKVSAPDGGGVAGVTVTSELCGTPLRQVVKTDESGIAEFAGLPFHQLLLWTTPASGHAAPPSMTVIPAGQTIELTLRTATPLRGRVCDSAGRGRSAGVRVYHGAELAAFCDTAPDGSFEVFLPTEFAGPFTVKAVSRAGETGSTREVVRESAPVRVTLGDE